MLVVHCTVARPPSTSRSAPEPKYCISVARNGSRRSSSQPAGRRAGSTSMRTPVGRPPMIADSVALADFAPEWMS